MEVCAGLDISFVSTNQVINIQLLTAVEHHIPLAMNSTAEYSRLLAILKLRTLGSSSTVIQLISARAVQSTTIAATPGATSAHQCHWQDCYLLSATKEICCSTEATWTT